MKKVFLICLLCGLMLSSGCTLGQLTPKPIKDNLIAARADGMVTLLNIEEGRESPEAAIDALRRIVGTKEQDYENGWLSPVYFYFTGTKPKGD